MCRCADVQMCIIILDRGGTQGVVAFDLVVPVMIMYNIYSHIKSTLMECNIQDMTCALRRRVQRVLSKAASRLGPMVV
jgi:hypothetical protein